MNKLGERCEKYGIGLHRKTTGRGIVLIKTILIGMLETIHFIKNERAYDDMIYLSVSFDHDKKMYPANRSTFLVLLKTRSKEMSSNRN
jgi:hypothetical protein